MKNNACKIVLVVSNWKELEKCPEQYLDKLSAILFQVKTGNENYFFKKDKFKNIPFVFSLKNNKDKEQRKSILLKAVQYFDFIQLDFEHDLLPAILEKIPKEKRWISWKGRVSSVEEMEAIFNKMKTVGAAHYHLITVPEKAADTLLSLLFLKRNLKQNITTYADGLQGLWTQIITLHFGSKHILAYPKENNPTSGFSIYQLIKDYDLPNLYSFKTICGIIGNPVYKTQSPQLHNAAYRQLKMDALYLPFNFFSYTDFWNGIVQNPLTEKLGLNIKGLTTVSPFKEKAVELADVIPSSLVNKIGVGNLLIKKENKWMACTTDSTGVLEGLKKRNIAIHNLKVAIIGCGGAGKAIAFALKRKGAEVTLVNRSLQRAKSAADLLDVPYTLLKDFSPAKYGLIVNATPIGKNNDGFSFDFDLIQKNCVIVDMIYRQPPTLLTKKARQSGLEVIDGFEILNTQVRNQFKGMTEMEMPLNI